MSDSFKTPRGQIGLLTTPTGTPQWLYAWEYRSSGGGGAYAILWVLIDRPGPTLVFVGTEKTGKWVTIADLARAVPDNSAGTELEGLRLQGGTPYTYPAQGFEVFKDVPGADVGTEGLGFQKAEVLFDAFAFGAPTLIAQIGRETETASRPINGIRVTPSEAAIALGIPLSGSEVAFTGAPAGFGGGALPVAPTAPPGGFGGAGPGESPPPVGKLSTGVAVPALVLLALAGGLLLFTQKAS